MLASSLNSRFRAVLVAIVFVAGACLSGCAAKVSDYEGESPKLDLREYFNGPVRAWGMVQDRSGKVIRRFEVEMVGRWEGDTGVLEEDFTYNDGEKQRRVWTFRRIDDGRYTGTADDVVGEATGEIYGNALRWRYVLEIEVDGRTWNINFDEWMYLLDEQTLFNRTVMKKFGLRVGEVTLFFLKQPADSGA